jgi:2-oxoglutarate dehydrogenase E2 component (dihydrolipoamide succinyltransferase)
VGQIVAVPMPHLGVSVQEGTVVAWHKAPGDEVRADEPLCDIATDKVDTELVSPVDGVLARIVVQEGDTVAVGEPLAELAVGGGVPVTLAATGDGVAPPAADPSADPAPAAVPAPPAQADAPNGIGLSARAAAGRDAHGAFDPAAAAEAVVACSRGGPLASPVARRIAQEHGLEVGALTGSGRRGRVSKRDVLDAVASRQARGQAAVAAGDLPRGYEGVPHEVIQTSRIRQAISEHMIRSRHTAAHMTTEVDVDLSPLWQVRAELNAERALAGRGKLSFLPFIARAACSALAEHPDLNATFEHDRTIRWKTVNLGVAVDTTEGLLVPVVHGCERLSAAAIGEAIATLAERARSRRLMPDDIVAGTFTISNPGSVGAVSAAAIINQPQVAILGIPTIVRRPWVVADERGGEAIAIRPILRLALTFDHRAVDGAEATRCAVDMKRRLEGWDRAAYG